MDIIGHRGSPAPETPENTLASVCAALDAGADSVEVDVRLTADGVAVCCHDPGLERVAGVASGVRRLTLAQLSAVRVGGHPLPTVAQVIDVVAGRGRLVLDLKPEQRTNRLVSAVAESVHHSGRAPDLILSSTEASVLVSCAVALPRAERAVILPGAEPFSQSLSQALRRGDHALHVAFRTIFARPEIVSSARSHGLRVRAWTVNRTVDARLLRLLDVDAVITDRPGELRSELDAPQQSVTLA
jgi:glycerophosphoryl diester phosphodiesterase